MQRVNMEKVKIQLVEKLPSNYECAICGMLLEDPVQDFDGVSACKRCFKLQIGSIVDASAGYFNDKAKQREIKSLKCYCYNRMVGCQWTGEIQNLQDHFTKCTFATQKCQFCQKDIPKEETFEHMSSCTEVVQAGECTFVNSGCTFQTDDVVEMKKHIVENTALHLQLQFSYITKLADESEEAKKQIAQLEDSKRKMELTFTTRFAEMMQQFTSLKKEIKMENEKSLKVVESKNLEASPLTVKGGSNSELNKIVQDNSLRLKNLELISQLQENTTTDGTILWKIDNFRERKNQSITGKITALHSAPCYVGNYGYKFCGRVYLNGDGVGKGTHLSLFIVIMKSEYDNLLQWPFTKMFRLTLINQKDKKLDIVEHLKPQKTSASYQKPVKEMNIATGCPMFIPIELLEKVGFVMDDSLFIEIKIEE